MLDQDQASGNQAVPRELVSQGKTIRKSGLTSSLAQRNPLSQGHQVSFLDGEI
jgi:hypothetical protein